MTPRTSREAMEAGVLFNVEFVGPGVLYLACPWSERPAEPLQLPYGIEIPWADTPEEAAASVRLMFPCSDRLALEVRRVIGGGVGGRLLDVPCHSDGGVAS